MPIDKIRVSAEAMLSMLKDSMPHSKMKHTREITKSSRTSAKLSSK